jgi:hypothetical protein
MVALFTPRGPAKPVDDFTEGRTLGSAQRVRINTPPTQFSQVRNVAAF